jgi:periplasmic protein TonB
MTAAAALSGWAPPRRVAARWIGSFALVILLHGAAAWLLLRPVPLLPPDQRPPAVIIDLEAPQPAPQAEETPAPAEPPPAPSDPTPPDPAAQEPVPPEPALEQPPVEEKLPEAVAPEAVLEQPPPLPVPPKPVVAVKPVPKPPPVRPHPVTQTTQSEPVQTAPAEAQSTATPAASSRASAAAAATSWQGRLQAHLARFKQYPAEARTRRFEGTPVVRFTMTRTGKVLSYRLENGSGHELLDHEALALIERAQPLPPLPDEMPQATIELVLPVRFQLH